MCKRIFAQIVVLAIVFGMSGLALANNEVDVNQVGGVSGGAYGKINYAAIEQTAVTSMIEIKQMAGAYH